MMELIRSIWNKITGASPAATSLAVQTPTPPATKESLSAEAAKLDERAEELREQIKAFEKEKLDFLLENRDAGPDELLKITIQKNRMDQKIQTLQTELADVLLEALSKKMQAQELSDE